MQDRELPGQGLREAAVVGDHEERTSVEEEPAEQPDDLADALRV
jgi:hypothetical protein